MEEEEPYFEDNDSDDDWFYNSIQKYDDLLIYEFQGKVSSACFLKEDRLVATCSNKNGRNEILELSVPDRLLATVNAGLVKNRDFNFVSAGYLKSTASNVIAHEDVLVTSETGGVNVYNLPNGSESDLITHKLNARETGNTEIALRIEGEVELFSGSDLKNIKSHSLASGREVIRIPEPNLKRNLEINSSLCYLDAHSSELVLGLSQVGTFVSVDLRSNDYQTINQRSTAHKWAYTSSSSAEKIYFLNSLGEIFVFDKRNQSKEIFQIQTNFNLLENDGKHLNVQLSPSGALISISGFDKCVKIYSLNSSGDESPIFVHDGHAKNSYCITGHLWHNSLVNVMFSYNDTGILHSWKFK